ncbi:DUF2280 domain-containing protein [Parvularcula flava]|uniref:DUF2280 domain-containing protein n=1 Tax=Aquisalinus luteolus TaxID=1566827 RepID=A0A8J3A3R8_9PROT|nr:DUF2280 domain-containing protein [Aquisalinus luteolus]NHK29180.1 DUF2280 domain-containing protein [Aquisalinus luteolus]GGI00057.1 hypothetical protein GCM10011355_27450 [Aquisalinus luteolus]
MANRRLSGEVKAFIVAALARFDTPTEVATQVKDTFGIEISLQSVNSHDPTKAAGKELAQKWRKLFEEERKRFREDVSAIPIANKSYRLSTLERMARKAEKMGNMALTAQLHEQAAKECGDAYTNRQKIDHGGSIEHRGLADFYAGRDPKSGS